MNESDNIQNFNYEQNNYQSGNSKKVITTIIIVCAIVLIGIGIGVEVYFLASSKKETNDMKLCKNVYLQVDNYNQNKISYNEFFENIMPEYNYYCNNEETELCKKIKSDNEEKEKIFKYQELEDCSKYAGISKDVCESTNNIKKSQNDNQETLADAYIAEIEMLCDMANE